MVEACIGIRVLDFTRGGAGPAAVALLADFGAQVFKISPPECGSVECTRLTHGEKRLIVDLASDEGLDIARCLVSTADVAVFSEPPERLARLGLDAGSALALNPRLIHTWMQSCPHDDDEDALEGLTAAGAIAGAILERRRSGVGRALVVEGVPAEA